MGSLCKLLRKLGLVVAAVLPALLALYLGSRWLGWRPYSAPPKAGESVDRIIQRLGAPHFDSRDNHGDTDERYILVYTDGMGTRYHLTVERGNVVRVEHSSR